MIGATMHQMVTRHSETRLTRSGHGSHVRHGPPSFGPLSPTAISRRTRQPKKTNWIEIVATTRLFRFTSRRTCNSLNSLERLTLQVRRSTGVRRQPLLLAAARLDAVLGAVSTNLTGR